MPLLLTISVTVIAAVMLGAAVCLIPVLIQVRRTAKEAEKLLETVRVQMVPLSRDLSLISAETNGMLQSLHRHLESIEGGVSAVRDSAERLREFEEGVLRRIEPPVFRLAKVIGGVSLGVETFFRTLLRSRREEDT